MNQAEYFKAGKLRVRDGGKVIIGSRGYGVLNLRSGDLISCCDCGLVHELGFKGKPMRFTVRLRPLATRAMRRRQSYKFKRR